MYEFKDQLNREIKNIHFLIDHIEKTAWLTQRGTLKLEHRSDKYYYYLRECNDRTISTKYLGTPSSKDVIDFKYNRFCIKRHQILKHDLDLLEKLSGSYKEYTPEAVHANLALAYQDLPDSCYDDQAAFFSSEEWADESYQKNSIPFGRNSCRTCTGMIVRSKGECIWYDSLVRAGIPFRYDCIITLKDESGRYHDISPDFVIKCSDGSFLVIEHVGMLLNKNYYENFSYKIKLYLLNDIVIGDNLIITSDNQYGGINSMMINEIIEKIIRPRVFTNLPQ